MQASSYRKTRSTLHNPSASLIECLVADNQVTQSYGKEGGAGWGVKRAQKWFNLSDLIISTAFHAPKTTSRDSVCILERRLTTVLRRYNPELTFTDLVRWLNINV